MYAFEGQAMVSEWYSVTGAAGNTRISGACPRKPTASCGRHDGADGCALHGYESRDVDLRIPRLFRLSHLRAVCGRQSHSELTNFEVQVQVAIYLLFCLCVPIQTTRANKKAIHKRSKLKWLYKTGKKKKEEKERQRG